MSYRNHILRRPEVRRADVLRTARRMADATVRRMERRLETRASSYGPVPLNDSHTLFGNYPMTSTGIRVDNYSASCNIVFRRCCEIIADGMGKLSPGWQLLDAAKAPNSAAVEVALVTEVANHYTTAFNLWRLIYDWAESWGNGYAWILRSRDLAPVGLFPLHPSRVSPRLVRNEDPQSPWPWDLIYQIDGGREIFLPYEILHIKGNPGFDGVTGYNVVQLHENVLAIAQAQDEYTGEFYANGAVAGGLVELPSNLPPAVVQKYQKDFQDRYTARGNRHRLAVVDSGVKFTETTISPENAQLLDSRKFSIYGIALMMGVPPTMLGDLSHGTYNNTEQQQLSFNQVKLHPEAENARQELNLKLARRPQVALRPAAAGRGRHDHADQLDPHGRGRPLEDGRGGPRGGRFARRGRGDDLSAAEHDGPAGLDAGQGGRRCVGKGGRRRGWPRRWRRGCKGGGLRRHAQRGANRARRDGRGRGAQPQYAAHAVCGARGRGPGTRREPLAEGTPGGGGGAFTRLPRCRGPLRHQGGQGRRRPDKALAEGHAEVFERKVGDFYDKHQGQVQETFTPALRALQTARARQVAEERSGDMQMPDNAAVGAYAKAQAGGAVRS